MSLLTQNELIDIKLYYQVKGNKGRKTIKVLSDKEAKNIMDVNEKAKKDFESKEENKDKEFELNPAEKVEILNTKWKEASWKEHNDSLKKCMKKDDYNNYEVDQIQFRDLKVKQGLKEWDLKDSNGNPVPCTPDIIDQLPFDVMMSLLNKYDNIMLLGEEDEKK